MLVLGIILVLLAGGALVVAIAGGAAETAAFELGAVSGEASTLSVFLAGAVTVLLLVLGIALVRSGLRQARRRHKEKKELHRLTQKLESREAAAAGPATSQDSTTSPAIEHDTASPSAGHDTTTTTRTETTASQDDGGVTGQDRPTR